MGDGSVCGCGAWGLTHGLERASSDQAGSEQGQSVPDRGACVPHTTLSARPRCYTIELRSSLERNWPPTCQAACYHTNRTPMHDKPTLFHLPVCASPRAASSPAASPPNGAAYS